MSEESYSHVIYDMTLAAAHTLVRLNPRNLWGTRGPSTAFRRANLNTLTLRSIAPCPPLLYHQFVDKLLLFVFGPLVVAAALLVFATGIRRTFARFRSRPNPDEMRATYEAYLRRLLNPQPDAVERELGKLLPERLLQLYQDKSAIQSAGFQLETPGKKGWWLKHWPVYCFEPLDTEALNELPYEEELGPGFCDLP